ncbi:MAG: hypothetical protein ABI658_16775 [Acidimicrobiales bacterium]
MQAKLNPRVNRILFGIVAICAVTGLFGSMRTTKVEIQTAVTAVNPQAGTARNAETIRYQDTNLELIAVYRVIDGQLDAAALPEYLRIWALAEETLPAEALAHIHQMNIVTDGPARTLGMVHRSTTERDSWILSIDPAESRDVLQHTLVHELAHLYTLAEGDLTSQRTNCAGVLIQIGCARTGSPLAEYAQRFWPATAEPARYSSDQFVSQYAADSVHEDLAETFMSWVYADNADSDTIGAKYLWFESIDNFVTARSEIQAKLRVA